MVPSDRSLRIAVIQQKQTPGVQVVAGRKQKHKEQVRHCKAPKLQRRQASTMRRQAMAVHFFLFIRLALAGGMALRDRAWSANSVRPLVWLQLSGEKFCMRKTASQQAALLITGLHRSFCMALALAGPLRDRVGVPTQGTHGVVTCVVAKIWHGSARSTRLAAQKGAKEAQKDTRSWPAFVQASCSTREEPA